MLDSINETELSKYLKKNTVKSQHGFTPKRSTTTNLAIYTNYINENLKTQEHKTNAI